MSGRAATTKGGAIASVEKGSIAEAAGIAAGDRLLSVNTRTVRDVIDYRFYAAEPAVEIELMDASGKTRRVAIEKHPDESIGIEFEEELFDTMKRCINHCPFCFVDGLPRGMRPSLYLKDDDYRLSFLHGNFITMTNMSDEDFERVAAQRLSPLYVSVHSTDPSTRERLLGTPRARDVMARLRFLTDNGIRVHAQVVVVPGINDGDGLDSTVDDLLALWPGVASVGVVPVGITRFQAPCEVRGLTDAEVASLVDWWWQRQPVVKRRLGYGFLFLADEAFLRNGSPFPVIEEYEDMPQYENGIGIGPSFLHELGQLRLPRSLGRPVHITIVCGKIAAPLLERAREAMAGIPGVEMRILPVENRFFGDTVTVSGLLTGQDVISALQSAPVAGTVMVPLVCLRDGVFLDGAGLEDVARATGCRVVSCGTGPGDILRFIREEGGVKGEARSRRRWKA